jgi:hypothetical protein
MPYIAPEIKEWSRAGSGRLNRELLAVDSIQHSALKLLKDYRRKAARILENPVLPSMRRSLLSRPTWREP